MRQEPSQPQSMEIPGEPEDDDMEQEEQSRPHRIGVLNQEISASSEEDEMLCQETIPEQVL